MLAAYWLAKGDARWRLVALIASIGQWFGVVIYFLEAYAQDFKYTRPEPFYFWAYFIGMNLPWFLIPMMLMKENISFLLKLLKKQTPQQQKVKST